MKELKIYVGFLTIVAVSSAVAFTIGKQQSKEKAETDKVIELETALETEEETELETVIQSIGAVLEAETTIKETTSEEETELTTEDSEVIKLETLIKNPEETVSVETEENVDQKENANTNEDESVEMETTGTEEFDNFQTEKENLLEALTNGDVELVKKLGKEYAITGRDFLFNGKEIKGVTFNELTEQGKKEVYDNLMIIDGWIMELDPDYKEQVKSGYEHTKNFAGKVKQKFKNWVSTWE